MAGQINEQTLETNLETIASLAEPHWSDNWNFRAYLQRHVSPEKIDFVALTIYQEVSAKIDCTSCGNCCREVFPQMDANNVNRLAIGLGKTMEEILTLTYNIDDQTVAFCESPCPLLADNKCTAYKIRPLECREYPHLDKPDFLGGSIGTIENYGTCPIVFNTYSKMKKAFKYDSNFDYIGDSDPETTHGSLFTK